MKKPSNRKERIALLERKKGIDYVKSMYTMTDGEVKRHFDIIYKKLIAMPDYEEIKKLPTCLRCDCEVDVEFHTYCLCGTDRAIYSVEDWKRDIKDNSERIDGDSEFIANGYKLN